MSQSIVLRNYTSIRDGKLRKDIFECMGDKLFIIRDTQSFLYTVLKMISPVNKYLRNNSASIEKACTDILKHFGLDNSPQKAYLVSQNEDSNAAEETSIPVTLIDKMWKYVLQLSALPFETYQELRSMIDHDLEELQKLIKWYEEMPVMKKINKNGNRPANHEEKIHYDFYQRCIEEREIIVDYLTVGLRKRALAKAGDHEGFSLAPQDFEDRPYFFGKGGYRELFNQPYFDYRQIDQTRHKFIDIKSNWRISDKLYKKDKTAFYRKLLLLNKPDAIFAEMMCGLDRLPFTNDRKPIFFELRTLFHLGQWIGFYALALSQVEGIFSEMHSAIQATEEKKWQSLPNKVNQLRSHAPFGHSSFDYYEYCIPLQRNKFMHVGVSDEYELRSYELLFDLRYLIIAFSELDNPYVQAYRHMKRSDSRSFTCFTSFTYYFEWLEKIPKEKMALLEGGGFALFEQDILVKKTPIAQICTDVSVQLPNVITAFVSEINNRIISKAPINFSDMKALKALVSDNGMKSILSDFYKANRNKVGALSEYATFLNGVFKYLPSLDIGSKKVMAEINSRYGQILKHIRLLGELVYEEDEILFRSTYGGGTKRGTFKTLTVHTDIYRY